MRLETYKFTETSGWDAVPDTTLDSSQTMTLTLMWEN